MVTKGQFGALPNDSASSALVPFGRTADLYMHAGGGRGFGPKVTLPFGSHPTLGWFNDKLSGVEIFPWTDLYLSTDDPAVPSPLSFSISYSRPSGGGEAKVEVSIGYDTSKRYYKELRHRLTPSERKALNVWVATKNGDAGRDVSVRGDELVVRVWVQPRPLAGARNWIGVRITV